MIKIYKYLDHQVNKQVHILNIFPSTIYSMHIFIDLSIKKSFILQEVCFLGKFPPPFTPTIKPTFVSNPNLVL